MGFHAAVVLRVAVVDALGDPLQKVSREIWAGMVLMNSLISVMQ
jgi:hypothetical protein